MKLQKLHEQFIEKAERPMSFGRLPVSPKEHETPIIPAERWHEIDGALQKTYRFRRPEDKDDFIMSLLAYEKKCGHNARIVIDEDIVSLVVRTKDIDKVTEIDKEYAKYADVLFRNIVYSPRYED